jgi:glycosyltransferase involved in cell wall biosynthesis
MHSTPRDEGKVDFHLHSYASNVTDYYAANALAIPESYSDPKEVYALLKQRGMSLVTFTDHNSIDGVKELLDDGREDVFISSEMTTTFPEDGCNVHITVANMTEAQFGEVDRLRGNVYEMIAYVDGEIAKEWEHTATGARNRLAYFMTHPLMSTQNRAYGREGSLSIEHLEKLLVLSNAFEVQNGARTKALNDLTLGMIRALDPKMIERFADKHGLVPKGEAPWLKAILGGSDDHSGINPGKTWTRFPFAGKTPQPNDVIDAIRQRRTAPAGAHGGPITLAHSMLKLLYDGSVRGKAATAGPSKAMTLGPSVQSVLRLVFDGPSESPVARLLLRLRILANEMQERLSGKPKGPGEPFERIFASEVYSLLGDPAFRASLHRDTDERIFLVVGTLLNRIFARYVDNLRHAGTTNVVCVIKELVALVTSNFFVSLPYLMSFLAQSSDSLVSRDVRKRFDLAERQKVVLLTDTFFEINGVAASIKRMIREAMRRDLDFTVLTCLGDDEKAEHTADPEIRRFIEAGRLKILPAVARLDLPKYDRLQIRFPPFLELLRYLQEEGFTKMQISTPGIIGVSGLLAAKMLQIETAATYHTSIPEYVENYTRDISLEALAWKYMIAFYHTVDEVLVPSKFIARLLHKRGLRNRKLLILDRWVDIERFHPRHRTPGLWSELGVPNADRLVKFVYVGRIGVEKNLQLVADAYRRLRATRSDCHLIILGDGPFRADLEKLVEGLPVTFTGFLERDELCRAIASADVKLFPSTTDTWGNAPLEAQASGLPVIVSQVGGPAELMIHGKTGLMISGRDPVELRDAMEQLMDNDVRERMAKQARIYVEENRVDEPFTAIFDAEALRRRLRSAKGVADGMVDEGVVPELPDLSRVYFVETAEDTQGGARDVA